MAILEFRKPLDEFGDPESMNREDLERYLTALQDELAALDAREPKNPNSEAYEEWADRHEDLEDLVDEVLDRLDEMGT